MEKFKFRLEGLLKIHKMKEERIKIELGKILQGIQYSKERIVELNANSALIYKTYERELRDSMKGSMLQFLPEEVSANKNKIKIEKEKVAKLEEEYQKKIVELNSARGDTKLIGSLKDKRKSDYIKSVRRKESIERDSMNIIMAGSKAEER